jgi:hypothetical protein
MSAIGTHGQRLDLRIKQGATFRAQFTVQQSNGSPADLTGAIARAQIRASTDAAAPAAAFTTAITLPNIIELSLTDAQTSAIPVTGAQQNYVWDMEIVWADGTVDSPLFGTAIVRAEVTR